MSRAFGPLTPDLSADEQRLRSEQPTIAFDDRHLRQMSDHWLRLSYGGPDDIVGFVGRTNLPKPCNASLDCSSEESTLADTPDGEPNSADPLHNREKTTTPAPDSSPIAEIQRWFQEIKPPYNLEVIQTFNSMYKLFYSRLSREDKRFIELEVVEALIDGAEEPNLVARIFGVV